MVEQELKKSMRGTELGAHASAPVVIEERESFAGNRDDQIDGLER